MKADGAAGVDLIVRNARIFTVDTERPWATALAVHDGRFSFVGDDEGLSAHRGSATEILDAGGALVVPGLIDSHTHAYEGGRAALAAVRLSADDDLDSLIAAAAAAADAAPPGEWLTGAGWSVGRLLGTVGEPEALRRFDDATGGRPAALRDSSHHAVFANTTAMERAGLGRDTPAPPHGSVLRHGDGALSGLFLETACALIDRAMPPPAPAEREGYARHAVSLYNGFGVTGFVHAATSEATMATFAALDRRGELSAWVATCIATDTLLTPERDGVGEAVIARRAAHRTGHVGVDFAKYFLDGVPGSRTASFIAPYLDGPSEPVPPFFSVEELAGLIAPLDAAGIHVKLHAVGDWAIRTALDAIALVRERNGSDGPAHSIAHASYIAASDIPRLATLDVVADFCPPLWFPNPILQANARLLGEARSQTAWPISDIVRSGALAVAGTDWPIVPSPNPWPGIAALVTRRHPAGTAEAAFRPEQALSVAQALTLCTLNVAKMMGISERTGSIRAGKSGDFAMLDRDLFTIDPTEIAGTRAVRTYFAGRLVHCGQG
ncbi:amidohydrolase [uncultured Bosea sp.]|uniref:amidohydrolase n=1 Tax=uncultured Bosea sp. TaxID=211457 RepID=UPI0025F2D53D|nr:amidohydrolase [uncultured Bosea sp.]